MRRAILALPFVLFAGPAGAQVISDGSGGVFSVEETALVLEILSANITDAAGNAYPYTIRQLRRSGGTRGACGKVQAGTDPGDYPFYINLDAGSLRILWPDLPTEVAEEYKGILGLFGCLSAE